MNITVALGLPFLRGSSADTVPPSGFDTTSYNSTTGSGIGGSTGAPLRWDAASRWASDTAWRPNFAHYDTSPGQRPSWIYADQSKNGTGDASSLYTDGRYIDLAVWQTAVQYAGTPVFAYTLPGANLGGETATPELATLISAGTYSVRLWVRRRYQANWTNVGDADSVAGIAYNLTQNAAFKIGIWSNYSSGRGGPSTSNGAGSMAGLDLMNNPGNVNGVPESSSGYTFGTVEWSAASNWYDYEIHADQFTGSDGKVWTAVAAWGRQIGQSTTTRLGRRLTGSTLGASFADIQEIIATSLNMNQSFKTDQTYWQWGWAAWDAASTNDPFGTLAYENTLTPENPGTDLNLSTHVGTTCTFTCTINRYTKYLRVLIDGVADPLQDATILPEVADGGTATVVFTISTGTHLVKVRAVNGNATATSVADSNTVTVSDAPINLLTDPDDLTTAAWAWANSTGTVAQVGGITLPGGGTGTVSEVDFTNVADNTRQQAVAVSGGTASKTFTLSAYVRMVSGVGTIRFKNTHGGVVDNISSDQALTTSWTLITYPITNGGSAGTGNQIVGFVNGTAGLSQAVYISGAILTM